MSYSQKNSKTTFLSSNQSDYRDEQQMSESRRESGPGAISRFRAVVVASLRVKQLRRGAKPRIELNHKKHKDTIIAMEEVRRGLISFTQSGLPHIVQHDYAVLSSIPSVDDHNGMGDLKASVEESPPVLIVQ